MPSSPPFLSFDLSGDKLYENGTFERSSFDLLVYFDESFDFLKEVEGIKE